MEEKKQIELMIGGVKVHFPFKPYPSQLSMMSMIVKGLQRSEHCLLESPTGSGKSLALLCSALAWQQEQQTRIAKKADKDLLENCDDSCMDKAESSTPENKSKERVPTIWFGTRTHKQIAQITHELATTAYKHVNMSILSSREHACIHPVNSTSSNKNDGCKDLRKGVHPELPGTHCLYYQNVNRMRSHSNLHNCGLTQAWDLEDLVQLGTRIKACPYYSARELQKTASIIFCPYNYLIDPNIRSSMMINLKNDVVILDEAHNIEDTSRESASFTAVESDLLSTIADIDHLIANEVTVEEHQKLNLMCSKMGNWMNEHISDLKESGYETWSKVWTGGEFIPHLDSWGVTSDMLMLLVEAFLKATETKEDEEEGEDGKPPLIMNSATQAFLGSLFTVLKYILANDLKFAEDYRVTMIRSAQFGIPPAKKTRDGWVSINKRKSKFFTLKLHFWCFNPGVAFADMADTRCIILTSGTLSPMSSFSSELGLSFPIQLEAAHVISPSQVWVGSVGAGPNGHRLQATYENTNSLGFQDELGLLVHSVCTVVPYGVLCFFSSYKMLEKLCERWVNTGIWDKISLKKEIVCEPHGRNKADFNSVLKRFYSTIAMVGTNDLTGALFLAVCRGKASEGLDFADNNARAVITVGIPFPNYRDKQVELKKSYNNCHSRDRGLLTGGEWYEIQAFRALNQALGRCIRHRNDWGALIIVDDRFCKNPKKYCKGLSKWVRQKVRSFENFDAVEKSLVSFCNTQSHQSNACDLSTTFDAGSFAMTSTQAVSNQTTISMSETISHSRSLISDHFMVQSKQTKKEISGKENKFSNPSKTNVGKQKVERTKHSLKTRSKEVKKERNPSNLEGDRPNTEKSNVIVISGTPEKDLKLIIIPESPDVKTDDEDDFKPFSASAKRIRSRSDETSSTKTRKPTIANQLAKKCKLSLNFNGSESLTTKDTNKETSTKNVKEKARKRGRRSFLNIEDHSDSDSSHHNNLTCKCGQVILRATQNDFTIVDNKFHFLHKFLDKSESLISVQRNLLSDLCQISHTLLNGAALNAVWSDTDKQTFYIFECQCCNDIIGFQIISHSELSNKILFLPRRVTLNTI